MIITRQSQKRKFELNNLYDILVEMIKDTDPTQFDYEKDFQNALESLLDKRFVELPEVRTLPLSDDDHSHWRLDFVVKLNDQFVPIELKFRHNDQSVNGYAADFIDDVHRINSLISEYDDIVKGFAICLTNNKEFVKDCDSKISEYDSSKLSEGHYDNVICWETMADNYYIGIVRRIPHHDRAKKNKFFSPFWRENVESKK